MDDEQAKNEAENPVPIQPDTEQPPIVDPATLNQDLPDEYIPKKIESEEGGVGSQYTVPINNYASFKGAVNGRGFDIDSFYGWQCWDGAALLWQQLGLALLTGNGQAIGCWDLKRNVNKYNKFDLITNVNALKLGDVVCMRPNHIGFFDGYDGAYMRILAENQGGTKGPNGGMAFNIVRITKAAFAGAFRYHGWNPAPVPAPAPKPATGTYRVVRTINGYINSADAKNRRNPRVKVGAGNYYVFNTAVGMVNVTSKKGVPGSWINPAENQGPAAPAKKSNEVIAREVVQGKWGNGDVRRIRLQKAGYNYNVIQAIVNRLV